MSDLDLRDPHMFVNFLGCRDLTDTPLVGFSVNGNLQSAIQTDGDVDGYLDQSLAVVFQPLNQLDGETVYAELQFPACTAPLASTVCRRTPAAAPSIPLQVTSASAGTCLAPVAMTLRPYVPAVVSSAAPCYVSITPFEITVNLGGIPMPLRDATIAATYVGNPAGSTVNGLLRGFLRESDAMTTVIPSTMPLVGGQPVASLLAGGIGNCAPYSDMDILNGAFGWWVYLNFAAPRVTWVDN